MLYVDLCPFIWLFSFIVAGMSQETHFVNHGERRDCCKSFAACHVVLLSCWNVVHWFLSFVEDAWYVSGNGRSMMMMMMMMILLCWLSLFDMSTIIGCFCALDCLIFYIFSSCHKNDAYFEHHFRWLCFSMQSVSFIVFIDKITCGSLISTLNFFLTWSNITETNFE